MILLGNYIRLKYKRESLRKGRKRPPVRRARIRGRQQGEPAEMDKKSPACVQKTCPQTLAGTQRKV